MRQKRAVAATDAKSLGWQISKARDSCEQVQKGQLQQGRLAGIAIVRPNRVVRLVCQGMLSWTYRVGPLSYK